MNGALVSRTYMQTPKASWIQTMLLLGHFQKAFTLGTIPIIRFVFGASMHTAASPKDSCKPRISKSATSTITQWPMEPLKPSPMLGFGSKTISTCLKLESLKTMNGLRFMASSISGGKRFNPLISPLHPWPFCLFKLNSHGTMV